MADRATALIAELEASTTARELVKPAVGRAREALSRAGAAPPALAPLLEDTALEWAEVARDLVRASAAERVSDALEEEATALQTEIARLRAAIEQATARVGRTQQELKKLEASPAKAGAIRSSRVPANDGAAPARSAPGKSGAASPPGDAATRGATP